MIIYIEVLVLLGIGAVLLIGAAIKLFTGWLGRRRYKPENDRSALGETKRRLDIEAAAAALGSRRLAESSPRGNISPAIISSYGEDNDGGRETGRGFRNPFKRRL